MKMGKRRKIELKYRKRYNIDYIPKEESYRAIDDWLVNDIIKAQRTIGNGIRLITNNLATAGIYDKFSLEWKIVDVYTEIEDNDTCTFFIKKKILLASRLLDNGYKVCIRCAAGMNRSNNIATSVLVYRDKSTSIIKAWDCYRDLVKQKVDRAEWMSSLLSLTCIRALIELRGGEI